MLYSSPETPTDPQPSYQSLSNPFGISKNTDLTSRGGLKSKASKILCVMENSLFMQESDGRKPD